MLRTLCLAALTLSSPALAIQASYTPLGSLFGTSTDNAAQALSADASVIVGGAAGPTGYEAFRWSEGTGMEGLGFLPVGYRSLASGVSANGKVITGTVFLGSVVNPDGFEAFRWTAAEGMVGLGGLFGSRALSSASAVSPDGTAIVGTAQNPLDFEAFLWTETGGMQPLGDLPGGSFYSQAFAVSSGGQHVVGVSFSDSQGFNTREAFLWTAASGMQSLGMTNTGLQTDTATVVTPDGSQVFGYALSGSDRVPFRWTVATGAIEMTAVGANFVSAVPTSASSDGQAVAFSDYTTINNQAQRAGLLLPAAGMIQGAKLLLNTGGATIPATTKLGYAIVSLDGQALAGSATYPGVTEEAWLGSLAPLIPAAVGQVYCGPQVPSSSGVGATLTGIGSTETDLNFLRLEAADMPLGQFGYFLASMTQGLVQQPGNSQGNLCLGGAIARYTGSVFSTGATGAADMTIDLAAIPAPTGSVSVLAGETWNFQGWFRDANPAPTSNFTTGLSVDFD